MNDEEYDEKIRSCAADNVSIEDLVEFLGIEEEIRNRAYEQLGDWIFEYGVETILDEFKYYCIDERIENEEN